MTKDILFLLIALTALLIILTSTIKEVIDLLHVYYSSAAHPGRIRGASDPGPGKDDFVELEGMRYNVSWIIKEGEYL